MTDPAPSARPEAQDVDLVEIATKALWDVRLQPKAGVPEEQIRRRNTEVVLAAVTPVIERRALERLYDQFRDDHQGNGLYHVRTFDRWLTRQLAALDQETPHDH